MIARFRKKTPAVVLGLALVALLATPAAAQAPTSPLSGIVTGTIGEIGTAGAGTVAGTIGLTNFVLQNGQLFARATLNATVTNTLTGVVSTLRAFITVPITVLPPPPGVCQILTLDVGPIHLDLLGLNVDTNRIVVLVTAVSGQGRLLGNLLCAVAGLLDPLDAGALENLLDRILGILNDL